jgi:DNA-binding LytR/AlgR family response regulator
MNKVKVLIVEDELIIAMNITDILEDLGYETLEVASSYEEAVKLLKSEDPDIAILDVQLKGSKNGIDLAQFIREEYDIPFIFLTSNSGKETVEKAKSVNPSSFLVKPFNTDDLFTSIEIALHNYNQQKKASANDEGVLVNDALFIKEKGSFIKVKLDEILFFKSHHVYLEVHTKSGGNHLLRSSFNSISTYLPKHFFRVHRSFMINLNHLDSIKSHSLTIQDMEVPLSKRFRDELFQIIQIP